ncbi:MAG: OmpA family protein [Arcobacter sp.]|nr:OmpA family protein [Arcobacter sp.]
MKTNKNGETNFWISYADLMAGLLFVFILLIGAIIVKYSLLQSESKLLEKTLENEKIALEKNKKELEEKELKIKNTVYNLQVTKNDLNNVKDEYKDKIKELKNSLIENEQLKIELKNKKDIIKNQNTKLNDNKNKLLLFSTSKKELESKLQELLVEKKILDKDIDDLNKDLKTKDEKISFFINEKEVFKNEINQLNLKKDNLSLIVGKLNENLKTKNEKLSKLAEDVLIKEKLILNFKEKNILLDDEIKVLSTKLEKTKNNHNILKKDLQSTKIKIKNLTGLKIKVITLLKNKLGKNMEIDPNNGAIRLSSSILFDEGEYELKESSRLSLKNAIYDYFYTILENEEINKHIDKIIIEGHTNSKGTFLFNLELSQKRAYSVMQFLLSLDFKSKEELKELIVASGRSFLDPIYKPDGTEDPEESRRIEIKFSLKNEESIREIANILE